MKGLLIIIGLCGGMMACSQATVLSQDMNGGVLVVAGITEDAMLQAASEKMRRHCGNRGYQIVARNTVVVRKERYARSTYKDQVQQNSNARSGMKSSSSMNSGANHTNSWMDSTMDVEHEESDSMSNTAQGKSESVEGVRDITEHRLKYRCGT